MHNSYKWVILVVSFLMMMGFALSLQVLPPLFDLIIKDVYFTNSQAGTLMGAFAIPGVFLPFLVAHLANWYPIKRMILVALIVMIAGLTAFPTAQSFSLLLIYRLITGVGATVLVVLAPLLITMYFDQKNIGIAMGIFNIAVPAGTVLAANIFGFLGELVGWKTILVGVAGYLGILLVLVFFALSLSNNQARDNSKTSEPESTRKFSGSLNLWLLGAIWALANVQNLGYMTFGSQFYQSLGMAVPQAGFLTSLIMFVSIFVSPLIGLIFDKTGHKKPFLLIGSIITLISFIFIAKNFLYLPLWATALGIGFAPIPIFIFAYLPETVKPHQVGMGLGLLTVSSNLGTTLGPTVIGSILDQTNGDFTIAIMVLAIVSIAIILISLLLKPKAKES